MLTVFAAIKRKLPFARGVDHKQRRTATAQKLINLWKGSGSFRGDSGVGTWIWKVSLNTCISHDRTQRRRPRTESLSLDIDLFEDSDEGTRQAGLLRERISKLGPFDRAIVLLWLENLSYDEIGQIVGISAKNVSVRLVRIKEQLKKMQ